MIRRLLLLLFFASGCAALIYEIVWFYLVELIVGASSISVAVLLASFMGGMALGSLLLPRFVPSRWPPFKVVAALELAIGGIGLAMPVLLPWVQQTYVTLAGHGSPGVLLRAAVSALVLIPPTLLMGATLPAIARWTDSTPEGAATIGRLYMANILGAAAGTALAGFYLLRVFDTVVASMVAVGLNWAVAAGLWLLARLQRETTTPARMNDAPPGPPGAPDAHPMSLAAIHAVAALSGFTALGAEVVWTRQVSLLFGASVYTFSLILAVFLGGLGGGSIVGSSLSRRHPHPGRLLGICQLLLVASIAWAAWAIVNVLPRWQPTSTFLAWVRATPALTFAVDALRCAVAFGPATLCWGASFPLAVAAASRGHDPGQAVSRVNGINTLGALAGAVGVTLIGIPTLGSTHAQQLLVACAALSAAIPLLLAGPRRVPAALGIGAVAAASAFAVPPVPGALIAYGRSVNSWDSIKQFLYLAEGATASVAVTEGRGGARQFHIAGKVEASDMDIDMRLERMLGHVPALLHGGARRVLVVGNGAGVTAGALASDPDIERIVICEIEPVVPASAKAYFSEVNGRVLEDPRVTIVYDDGRHFLQTTQETFDIITTDPIHPWVRGAATLYSLEYLQLVRSRLAPGGVVTQWVPLYETDAASVKSQLGTFAQVFPDMTLWNPDLTEEGYDLVVLGRTEHTPIDEARLDLEMQRHARVRQSLNGVRLVNGLSLMGTYAGRRDDLAPWLADAHINRERHLRLQYLAGLAANTDQRFAIFQAILDYRRYPADLFRASAVSEMQLRDWYARSVSGGPLSTGFRADH